MRAGIPATAQTQKSAKLTLRGEHDCAAAPWEYGKVEFPGMPRRINGGFRNRGTPGNWEARDVGQPEIRPPYAGIIPNS